MGLSRNLFSGGWVPFSQLALFGDSILQNNSYWIPIAQNGTGATSIRNTVVMQKAAMEGINVAIVNGGASQSLSVTVVGKTVTIYPATNGSSAITSTTKQIGDALNANSAYLALGLSCGYFGTTNVPVVSSPVYLAAGGQMYAKGFAQYAQTILKGRFDFVKRTSITGFATQTGPAWSIASSGITAMQLLDNPGAMGDLLRDTPAGVPVFTNAGSNDVQGTSGVGAETTVANRVIALWDIIRATGRSVIGGEILPCVNSTKTTLAAATNVILKAAASARGIPWTEWPPAAIVSGAPNPDWFDSDLIHPNLIGAQKLGESFASQISALCQPTEFALPASGSARWKTLNPYITGGSGIATSWTEPNGPSGGTATPTKETIDGDLWQVLTIAQSGTYNLCLTSITGTVTPGDFVRLVGQLKVSSGFKNVNLQCNFGGAGGSLQANRSALGSEFTEIAAGLEAWEGTMLTGWDFVPAGATTCTVFLNTYGAGVIKYRGVGLISQT